MLKIYIANLGKYNEGELVGKWVELPCEDLDEVLKEIEVVDGTAYEEYAIHDYESDIEGLNIGEYDNIFSLITCNYESPNLSASILQIKSRSL